MENTETQVWLDFALACEYIPKDFLMILINDLKKSDDYLIT